MKRTAFYCICVLAMAVAAVGQQRVSFTGTAVIYGSGFNTRTVTRLFTMTLTGETSRADAARYLDVLARGGQDDLLRAIDDNDLGRFSFAGTVGQPLLAVLVDQEGSDTRIRAVFQRWVGFGELRRGARSVDYPFGYVEIRVDRRTGRGEGTIIPAARIRFREGRNGGGTVEIEDFGTFPGRLLGVTMRGRMLG